MKTAEIITKNMIRQMLPARRADAHKGDCGRVFVIAGSVGMAGAALLCAGAALRGGAGLVRVCIPQELFPVIHAGAPEATCVDRSPSALRDFSEYDAIAMGPGLGTDDETAGVVKNILDSYDGKLVVDADALNIIAARGLATGGKERGARGRGLIITPHPREAGRLLGVSSADVNADRSAAARSLAERYGAVALLKGRGTVIALPDGYYKVGPYMDGGLYENPTGNPGMATAGSGDVLTGLILALLGQGLDAADAALAGAYLHGLAGDIAAKEKGAHGLIASDIREAIPYAIKSTVSIDTML